MKTSRHIDVMLVNPMFNRVFFDTPFLNVPLGLEYMQQALRDKGFNAEILNLDYEANPGGKKADNKRLSGTWFETRESLAAFKHQVEDGSEKWWAEYRAALEKYRPSLVGIGMVTPQFHAACMAARIAKEVLPDVKTAAGGIHCTVLPEEVAATGLFDAVAVSEGEKTVAALGDHFVNGSGDLGDIAGIYCKTGDDIVHTEPVELIGNLDDIAFPARECIVPPDVRMPTVKYSASIITSRGCPYKCTFCARQSLWMHHKVRYRSIDNIMEEIRHLRKKFELTYFYILDDTFNASKKRVMEFCDRMLRMKAGLKWYCYMRADRVDDEQVSHMKRAGLDWVYLGGESGSQEILDKMRRGITVEQVKEAAGILKKHGVAANCSFIAGHPDETPATLRETESLIRNLNVEKTIVYFMVPFPGSEVFDTLKENGGLVTDDWFMYHMYYPSLIRRGGITDEELSSTVKRIYDFLDKRNRRARRKLLQPSFILEKLRTVHSPSRLKHLAGRFFSVLKDRM